MSERSLNTYDITAFELIELVQDGLMTEETFTVLSLLLANHSHLSAKTRNELTLLVGSMNSSLNVKTQEEWLGLSSISGAVRQAVTSSTQLSHSECWCKSSKKQDTND